MITAAFVNLFGDRCGAIAWDSARNTGVFEYDAAFIRSGLEPSPVLMPAFRAAGRVFSFPALARSDAFRGLPGLLADALPDAYGTALINAWLSSRGRPSGSLNAVEHLCFVGKRGMGALTFEPAVSDLDGDAGPVELDSLVRTAGDVLSRRGTFQTSLAADREKALIDILRIGSSAGGARAKAVIAFNEQTGEIRSGQAEAPPGFMHWLLKLDGVDDAQLGASHGYGRVEFAYYKMALAAGIDMTECRLLEENGRAHFMTKRFDRREDGSRIHMQSWCALRHADFNLVGAFSYNQLLETARLLRLPYNGKEQIFRRMVFNVLARNCDDHTKNTAFLMDESGAWTLAPAFDVCYAYRPGSIWVSRQSVSVNGKREEIAEPDFLAVAEAAGIKRPVEIIKEVTLAVQQWPDFAASAGVPEHRIDEIKSNLLV